jgi:hypothetical protein
VPSPGAARPPWCHSAWTPQPGRGRCCQTAPPPHPGMAAAQVWMCVCGGEGEREQCQRSGRTMIGVQGKQEGGRMYLLWQAMLLRAGVGTSGSMRQVSTAWRMSCSGSATSCSCWFKQIVPAHRGQQAESSSYPFSPRHTGITCLTCLQACQQEAPWLPVTIQPFPLAPGPSLPAMHPLPCKQEVPWLPQDRLSPSRMPPPPGTSYPQPGSSHPTSPACNFMPAPHPSLLSFNTFTTHTYIHHTPRGPPPLTLLRPLSWNSSCASR